MLILYKNRGKHKQFTNRFAHKPSGSLLTGLQGVTNTLLWPGI